MWFNSHIILHLESVVSWNSILKPFSAFSGWYYWHVLMTLASAISCSTDAAYSTVLLRCNGYLFLNSTFQAHLRITGCVTGWSVRIIRRTVKCCPSKMCVLGKQCLSLASKGVKIGKTHSFTVWACGKVKQVLQRWNTDTEVANKMVIACLVANCLVTGGTQQQTQWTNFFGEVWKSLMTCGQPIEKSPP